MSVLLNRYQLFFCLYFAELEAIDFKVIADGQAGAKVHGSSLLALLI